MYVLTDYKHFVGKDYRNCPLVVSAREHAATFKTELAAENYMKTMSEMLKLYDWRVIDKDRIVEEESYATEYSADSIEKNNFSVRTTPIEDDEIDLCGFFTEVINVMAYLDEYISNMIENEQKTDMKILDVRHYMRDNNHRLNAIQMQRLGYYLQSLEKERYEYKSNRLIASMFTEDINALKDKKNIEKMNDVLKSKYRPRILNDTDIEYIINKKKDAELICNF